MAVASEVGVQAHCQPSVGWLVPLQQSGSPLPSANSEDFYRERSRNGRDRWS